MADVDVGGISFTVDADTKKLLNSTKTVESTTKKMGEDFDAAGKKVDGFDKKLTALAASISGALIISQLTSAFNDFVVATAAAVDEQGKFAERIGVSFEELQKLQFAASQNGASISALNTGLQRMSRRLETVAQGGAPEVAEQLERMGIAIEDIQGLSPDQQFRAIADGIEQLGSDAERTRATFALFDTEGVALVNTLRQGSGAVDDLGKTLEDLGGVISTDTYLAAATFNDEMEKMELALGGAKTAIVGELYPAISRLISVFNEFLSTGDNATNLIKGLGVAATLTASIITGHLIKALAGYVVQAYSAATATAAATGAMGALRGVMAVLGGPAGLVLLSASALAYFASNTNTAAGEIRKLRDELEGARDSFRLLNQEQAAEKLRETEESIRKQREELSKLNDKLKEQQAQAEKTGRSFASGYGTSAQIAVNKTLVEIQKLGLELQNGEKDAEALRMRLEELASFASGQTFDSGTIAAPEFGEAHGLGGLTPQQQEEQLARLKAQLGDETALIEFEYQERNRKIRELTMFGSEEQALLLSNSGAMRAEQLQEITEREVEIERRAAEQRMQIQANLAKSILGSFSSITSGLIQSVDEQSGAYDVLFAAQKAAAVAQAIISAELAAAQVLAHDAGILGLGAIATSNIVRGLGYASAGVIAGTAIAGGRRSGGSVMGGKLYEVGEGNKPEMFNSGGKSYMIPGNQGEVISNSDLTGGAGGWNIQIDINNLGEPMQVSDQRMSVDEERRIVRMSVEAVAADIRGTTNGYVRSAMRDHTDTTFTTGSGR